MTAKWVSCMILVGCLALLSGCRTPQPNLKPEKTPEKLVEPPQMGKYETTGYPKQAFDAPSDPAKQAIDNKGMAGMPARGMSTGAMGGVPGR